jgi:hypothetical protein
MYIIKIPAPRGGIFEPAKILDKLAASCGELHRRD